MTSSSLQSGPIGFGMHIPHSHVVSHQAVGSLSHTATTYTPTQYAQTTGSTQAANAFIGEANVGSYTPTCGRLPDSLRERGNSFIFNSGITLIATCAICKQHYQSAHPEPEEPIVPPRLAPYEFYIHYPDTTKIDGRIYAGLNKTIAIDDLQKYAKNRTCFKCNNKSLTVTSVMFSGCAYAFSTSAYTTFISTEKKPTRIPISTVIPDVEIDEDVEIPEDDLKAVLAYVVMSKHEGKPKPKYNRLNERFIAWNYIKDTESYKSRAQSIHTDFELGKRKVQKFIRLTEKDNALSFVEKIRIDCAQKLTEARQKMLELAGKTADFAASVSVAEYKETSSRLIRERAVANKMKREAEAKERMQAQPTGSTMPPEFPSPFATVSMTSLATLSPPLTHHEHKEESDTPYVSVSEDTDDDDVDELDRYSRYPRMHHHRRVNDIMELMEAKQSLSITKFQNLVSTMQSIYSAASVIDPIITDYHNVMNEITLFEEKYAEFEAMLNEEVSEMEVNALAIKDASVHGQFDMIQNIYYNINSLIRNIEDGIHKFASSLHVETHLVLQLETPAEYRARKQDRRERSEQSSDQIGQAAEVASDTDSSEEESYEEDSF